MKFKRFITRQDTAWLHCCVEYIKEAKKKVKGGTREWNKYVFIKNDEKKN